jgi:hypothetical protein
VVAAASAVAVAIAAAVEAAASVAVVAVATAAVVAAAMVARCATGVPTSPVVAAAVQVAAVQVAALPLTIRAPTRRGRSADVTLDRIVAIATTNRASAASTTINRSSIEIEWKRRGKPRRFSLSV